MQRGLCVIISGQTAEDIRHHRWVDHYRVCLVHIRSVVMTGGAKKKGDHIKAGEMANY